MGHVHELMQALDVYWMTPKPRSEGIPTSMEEAMALALPVVTFDVGSIAELVEHGVSGFVIRDQDPAAVAARTVEHLMDPARRAAMGNKGREFVVTHASLEACAERHMTAYRLARQNADARASMP